MRNVTMTCPECHEPDRAVGDPSEADDGHSGRWYCFGCGSHGTYEVAMTAVTRPDGEE